MARPRKISDEAVLAAAREVFLSLGAGAPLSAVAEKVGLTQPALSARFGSKQALLLRALLPPPQIPWAEALACGPEPGDLRPQLTHIARQIMDFFVDTLPAMAVLRSAGVDLISSATLHHDPPHERVRQQVCDYFARACAGGQLRDVDPEALAVVFIGSLQAPAMLAHVHSAPVTAQQAQQHAERVVEMLWWGIAPGEGAR